MRAVALTMDATRAAGVRDGDPIYIGGDALAHPVDGHRAEYVVVVGADGRVIPGATIMVWHGAADGTPRGSGA